MGIQTQLDQGSALIQPLDFFRYRWSLNPHLQLKEVLKTLPGGHWAIDQWLDVIVLLKIYSCAAQAGFFIFDLHNQQKGNLSYTLCFVHSNFWETNSELILEKNFSFSNTPSFNRIGFQKTKEEFYFRKKYIFKTNVK